MRMLLRLSVLTLAGLWLGQAAWAGPSTSSSGSGGTGSSGLDSPSNRGDQEAKAQAAAQERQAQQVAAMKVKYEKRLSDIIIPNFKVEGATARDTLKLIREQAKTNDPDGRGFNLLFTCTPAKLDTPITMDMNNVPVPDLLHFVGLAAGIDLKYEEHAVVVMNHVEPKN